MNPRRLFTYLAFTIASLGPASAQTYISAEPIPSQDIVGAANLNKILSIGYTNLERWSQNLLNDCNMVQNVINTLQAHHATTTITGANTRAVVAAGGFEGVTDPSFVLSLESSGPLAVSPADIFTLDNALGYVQSQSGTAQFTLPFNSSDPNTFPLDYAVVSFNGHLSGVQAKGFFDYLGTIDPALWSGTNAGFTQVNIGKSAVTNATANDSMLFLIGDVTIPEFTSGLFHAANTYPRASYSPLNHGAPTTATAGAAFPGNDWNAQPNGDGYLANLPSNPGLLSDLANLRQQYLQAVQNLLNAIGGKQNINVYLNNGHFLCPGETSKH